MSSFNKKTHKSRLIAVDDTNVLVLIKMQKRIKYTLVGGLKKKKETKVQSLIREAYEEIGVHLDETKLSNFITKKNINKQFQEVYKHYFIYTKSLKKLKILEPEKFKEAIWVPWYKALDYLDKQDRSAVMLYFE